MLGLDKENLLVGIKIVKIVNRALLGNFGDRKNNMLQPYVVIQYAIQFT